ncbi:MAG: PilT/PilU family type 4a pilus ATPase [Dehalococcoidales bacterium]|nr:PilT/PilU family type 4a pilus ATPase [Dehalococcoidales bacterium]
MNIHDMVRLANEMGASDLHIVAGNPLMLRVKGSITPVADFPTLSPGDIDVALKEVTSVAQMEEFQTTLELDFGFDVSEVGRVRCNAARQRGTTTLVMRILPSSIPSIDELGLPAVCKDLIQRPRGMVVISGPTGSGKSTTLSAMINFLNATRSRRIVTIEDPIEFVYRNEQCIITQRELGGDTKSFAEALRHVLRQDPDVILVGEMRDQETASAALTIAETGHLILTTGHAPSAAQAVERIIDLFPIEERDTVQSRIASLINGILCQALVPTADGKGRVAAIEVMLANSAIRSNIRDGKIFQIPNTMLTGARQGMVLLDNALVDLYKKGRITKESVLDFCNSPDDINKQLAGGSFM